MEQETYDIWIRRASRTVLLTDYPGPPDSLIISSDGTVGGTFFDAGCWITFLGGFDDAYRIAQIAAEVRGFTVSVEVSWAGCDEPVDEDVDGAEEWMDEEADEDLEEEFSDEDLKELDRFLQQG